MINQSYVKNVDICRIVRELLLRHVLIASAWVTCYGIRASEEDMESWVSENANGDGIIYTHRNGNVHLGIWTDDKTVVHLSRRYYDRVGSAPCPKCRFKLKTNTFSRKTCGAMVETCLECFLEGGFLYANEHCLRVTGTDTDSWIPYSNEIDHFIQNWLSDEVQLLDSDFFGNFLRMPTFLTKALADVTQTAQSSLKKLTHLRCKPYFLYDVMEVCFSKIMGASAIILVYKSNRVRVYQQHSIKPAEKVVADANEYLKNQFGIYDVLRNNCEHFAFKCKTGVATSIQVNTFPDELITSLIRNQGRVHQRYVRKLKKMFQSVIRINQFLKVQTDPV